MTSALDKEPVRAATPTPRRSVLAGVTPILAAVQFLTIAPALVRRPFAPVELGKAVGWFPLVGLLLGAILVGLDLLADLLFPRGVTAALVLMAWVVLTGALHLDGFLDSCDGLLGGQTPEARLRIMHDERVGAFAVIGGVLLFLVKFAVLATLPDRLPALLVAPALGRCGIVLALVAFPYARANGLGRDMKDHARWPQAMLAFATAALVAGFASGGRGFIALALTSAATFAGAAFALRRLPGLTGDIYGATCEVLETLVLLVFVAKVGV